MIDDVPPEGRIDAQFYRGIADELAGQLRRIATFTGHRGASGYYHEEILRNVIRGFLGARFSVRTGFVYHSQKVVSRQGDILIIDEAGPGPFFFRHGDFAIVDPRALVCFIEVKTALTKKTFIDAIENHKSFADVYDQSNSRVPMGLVFAFESRQFTARMLDGWYKSKRIEDRQLNYPTSIFSMTAGMLIHNASLQGHQIIVEPKQDLRVHSLSVFLAHIRKAVDMRIGVQSSAYEYAAIKDMTFSKEVFSFGRGLWVPPAHRASPDTL